MKISMEGYWKVRRGGGSQKPINFLNESTVWSLTAFSKGVGVGEGGWLNQNTLHVRGRGMDIFWNNTTDISAPSVACLITIIDK